MILFIFMIISFILIFGCLYLIYKDCSKEESEYIKRYSNSYNIKYKEKKYED